MSVFKAPAPEHDGFFLLEWIEGGATSAGWPFVGWDSLFGGLVAIGAPGAV